MNKAYGRINWENYPSENTALNEANLNKMDAALNEVDNRVVAHETTKLDVATANSMVKNVSFNERSGIFTITYLNGSTKELDTKLEKIATNFVYDEERQKLILTLIDGTTQEIDMSALITQYEFENSAYISFTVANGKVKAEIINGSITADKLQPNFLSDVTLQANSAKTSEQNAKISEENAKQSEINAKNYADSAEPVASTANGLNPTLDGSTDAPFIMLQGNGATIQDGTPTPDNEVPIYGVGESRNLVHTIGEGEALVVSGNIETNAPYRTIYANLPSAGKYFIHISCNENIYITRYKLNDKLIDVASKMNMLIITITEPSELVLSFRNTDTTNVFTNLQVQVEKGTTATPYKAYGAHSLSVKSTGKNLCPLGSKTGTLQVNIPIDYLTDGETYTFSGIITTDDTNATTSLASQYGTSGQLNHNQLARNSRVSEVFTKRTGDTLFIVYASNNYANSKGDAITVSDIQIEKGNKATPFEEYVETTADIPLSSPLYEGDYIRYNMDGTGEESHKKVKVVYDGSDDELWNINANCFMIYGFASKKDVSLSAKSSHFIGRTGVVAWWQLADGQCQNYDGAIGFKKADLTTVAEWKAWLAENPVTVVYEKAEPTVTPLTAGQIAEFEKLRTFDGTTHITCEAESEVQYFCDSVSGKAVASVVSKVERELSDFDITLARTSITAKSAFNKTKFDRSILSDFDYETGQVMSTDGDDLSVADALAHLEGAVIDIMNGVMANKAKIDALTS